MKQLILSGGGMKGLCYIGCLKYFEENNMLKDLELFVGTSIGALMGFTILIGYTSNELIELFSKINFTNLTNVTGDTILNFFKDFGIDNGEKLLNFINILIKKKRKENDNNPLTFKDFYNLNKINFCISAYCLNDKKTVYFNYKTHPDLDIALAIRMSISIPFYFIPVKFNDKTYIDGGLINNFPIDNKFIKDNKDTIALFFINNNNEKIVENINSFEIYCSHILDSYYKNIKKLYKKFNKAHLISLKLDFDIFMLEFNIDNEKINKCFDLGYSSISNYFKKIN